jgi:hypothetical protein
MRAPQPPPPGTRLPLSETERYFPTDPEFSLAGIAGKIRLITAQDRMLGPITVTDFAELLPLVDVIRWYSGEIQFPFGNLRSGVIVEWLAEVGVDPPVVGTLAATEAADSAAVVGSSERVEDTPQRTGLTGRPTKGLPFILADFRERIKRNECEPALIAEARELIRRYEEKYPVADKPGPKSLANRIAGEYRSWKAKKPPSA